jgi:hypothetical protein
MDKEAWMEKFAAGCGCLALSVKMEKRSEGILDDLQATARQGYDDFDQNNAVHTGLLGAAVGGSGMGLHAYLSGKGNIARNILVGALLGGGAGSAYNLISPTVKSVKDNADKQTPYSKNVGTVAQIVEDTTKDNKNALAGTAVGAVGGGVAGAGTGRTLGRVRERGVNKDLSKVIMTKDTEKVKAKVDAAQSALNSAEARLAQKNIEYEAELDAQLARKGGKKRDLTKLKAEIAALEKVELPRLQKTVATAQDEAVKLDDLRRLLGIATKPNKSLLRGAFNPLNYIPHPWRYLDAGHRRRQYVDANSGSLGIDTVNNARKSRLGTYTTLGGMLLGGGLGAAAGSQVDNGREFF